MSLMGAAFRTAKHAGTPKAAGGMAAKRVSRAPQNPIHLLRCAFLPWRSGLFQQCRKCWDVSMSWLPPHTQRDLE